MDNAHAAAVFGGVTADLAAVEVEIAAIQRHTAALLQPGVPGKRAAVEVDIRRLGENAAALVAAGASAQRAAQGNGRLGLVRAGEGIAVQANGQMLSRLQRQVGRNVARQVDARRAVRVGDLAAAVLCLPRGGSFLVLVAARADLAAADAVIKMCHHFDGRIPLNIVVLQGLFFLGQLLSLEDQLLPRRKRAFLFLNLDLNGRNGVRGFNIQGNVASRQGFDKNLHPALGKGRGRDQAQQQADGEQNTDVFLFRFLLVGQREFILHLQGSEEPLHDGVRDRADVQCGDGLQDLGDLRLRDVIDGKGLMRRKHSIFRSSVKYRSQGHSI